MLTLFYVLFCKAFCSNVPFTRKHIDKALLGAEATTLTPALVAILKIVSEPMHVRHDCNL